MMKMCRKNKVYSVKSMRIKNKKRTSKLNGLLISFLIILALLLCSCSAERHLFGTYQGLTTQEMIAKYGRPTMVQQRSQGEETWVYKTHGSELLMEGKTTYYYIIRNGIVIDQQVD